jgi:hypothetical protein
MDRKPLRAALLPRWGRVASTLGALGCVLGAACVGTFGDGDGGNANGNGNGNGKNSSSDAGAPPIPSDIDIGATGPDSVAQAPTRRLSNAEVANAFRALTGAMSMAATAFPPDSHNYTFDRVVQGQTVIDRTITGLAAMAEEAVVALTDAKLATFSAACAVTGTLGPDGAALAVARRPCAQGLLTTWAQTAYRRPLTSGEQATLLSLYDGAGTYRDGVDQIIRFVLQSPSFLYVVETGTPDPGRPGVVALTDYEIATRLSLLFCETLPDPPLLDAAAAGQLHEPAQIAAQAERLFGSSCAHQTMQDFYFQWLDLITVPALTPDPKAFPKFSEQVRDGMELEDKTFFDTMTFANGATLSDLFRADYTYADDSLAPIYGVTGLGATPQKVMLPEQRRGFLTHPSILSLTSHIDRTSPVYRGVFVIRNLLCLPLANPPQNVSTTLPPIAPNLSSRQQLEALTQPPLCRTCHGEIDPIGFGMEDFDGIGEYRTTDNSVPVDGSGAVPAIGIGAFDGAAALSAALADRPEVQLCMAREWLRFGLGRLEGQQDVTSLRALVDLGKGGASLHAVMVGLTGTYAFTHRAAPAGG